jgi:hypothetical protein
VLAHPLVPGPGTPHLPTGHVDEVFLGEALHGLLHSPRTSADRLGQVVQIGGVVRMHCAQDRRFRIRKVRLGHRAWERSILDEGEAGC